MDNGLINNKQLVTRNMYLAIKNNQLLAKNHIKPKIYLKIFVF